jgi:broad specificity phosphatase PhoE
MTRTLDLIRHTANEGDRLTPEGVAAAVELGRGMEGEYRFIASSGAQRATQTAGCVLAGMARPVPGGVVVVEALRSGLEDKWRAAYRTAGAGDLESLQAADPELVATDSAALAAGLHHIFSLLSDGERALAVGHSPTNEAAIYGLTGVVVEPIPKGGLVVITKEKDTYSVR